MKIYFLSSEPCALSLNGLYYGITDYFERYAEICLSDKIYTQFSPEGSLPIGFFITEEITEKPPLGCEVYLLRDGVAVYACDFPPADFTLRPVAQAREGNILATVFWQGKLQLSIESPEGFFNATLPPSFAPCEVLFCENLVIIRGKNALAVYGLNGKRLLLEQITEYSLLGNILTATLPLSDRLQRFAKCEWELKSGECKRTAFTLIQATENNAPSEDLLAYAFFESALIGEDFACFLSNELQLDAERIRSFLGDFIAVTLTDKPTVCGLVRVKKERLFAVDYYEVEIKDGKITDVRG